MKKQILTDSPTFELNLQIFPIVSREYQCLNVYTRLFSYLKSPTAIFKTELTLTNICYNLTLKY